MADRDVVVRVEHLSKKYSIGHENPGARHQGSFREALMRHARNLGRKTYDMARGRQIVQGDRVEDFWALRDVSFDVRRGEVLGIIGLNGAGKTTLLKVLSRITEPTSGRVTLRGRVASLLEVGTGFHAELSGRENIYLNGTILGMTRSEIDRRFDEIVDFAEVEAFLDTPVKRYSSGMYVRLAFAVAAHLDPEILVVDEVLAVGDVVFQKKCLGKMRSVADSGRTVFFVSHNLAAVKSLCSGALLLRNGAIGAQGDVASVLSTYLTRLQGGARARKPGNQSGFECVRILDGQKAEISVVDDRTVANVEFVLKPRPSSEWCQVAFTIFNADDVGLMSAVSPEFSLLVPRGVETFHFPVPTRMLKHGSYRIEGALFDQAGLIEQADHLTMFQVIRTSPFDVRHADNKGLIRVDGHWQHST